MQLVRLSEICRLYKLRVLAVSEKAPLTASHVGPGILLPSTRERPRVVAAALRDRAGGERHTRQPLLGASGKRAGPHGKAHWLAGPGPLAVRQVKKLPPFKKKMDLKTMTGNRSHCEEDIIQEENIQGTDVCFSAFIAHKRPYSSMKPFVYFNIATACKGFPAYITLT